MEEIKRKIFWVSSIIIFETLLHIIPVGGDILILTNLRSDTDELHSDQIQLQEKRIFVSSILILNEIAFMFCIRKSYNKLVLTTALIFEVLISMKKMFHLYLAVKVEIEEEPLNLFRTFDVHPITFFVLAASDSILHATKFTFLLKLWWKNETRHGLDTLTDRFCSLRLKGVHFAVTLGIPMVMNYILAFQRVKKLLSTEFRETTASKDPWYFLCTAALFFILVSVSIAYWVDVVGGMFKKDYRKLKRFYWMMTIILVGPNHPISSMILILERISEVEMFTMFMRPSVSCPISLYILTYLYAMFKYMKFLKHSHKISENYIDLLQNQQFKIFVIPQKCLTVSNKAAIGKGNSAIVYKGTLRTDKFFKTTLTPVAIKIFSGHYNEDTIATVLTEELRNMGRVMKHNGNHPNLVGFIGACFLSTGKNPSSLLGRVNIVMELCENGDLLSYVQNMKNTFSNTECSWNGAVEQMQIWAHEISRGMEYLVENKIIHGDLAARNVLLDNKLVAKIADFGMSRKMYEYQIYKSTKQQMFPWRWMAPESLCRLEFSTKSDVWSYGVLLWELFSLGESPWPGLEWTSNFGTRLMDGIRLSKPLVATESLYDDVMLPCWRTDAKDRPTFGEISAIVARRI